MHTKHRSYAQVANSIRRSQSGFRGRKPSRSGKFFIFPVFHQISLSFLTRTDNNVTEVAEFVKSDPMTSSRPASTETGISWRSLQRILHDGLQVVPPQNPAAARVR